VSEIVIEQVDWAARQQALLAIRYAVFVDEQGVPPELEQDEHDATATHLLARTPAGAPVGTARLLPDGHVGRMAVLPAWRGRGIGSDMLHTLIAIARALGHERVVLHAQCQAEAFYRRFGFVAEGEVFADAGIAHRRMALPLTGDHG
jgi:predicted GNAT family N-acyltransferase